MLPLNAIAHKIADIQQLVKGSKLIRIHVLKVRFAADIT
jgi:hypothetical protein